MGKINANRRKWWSNVGNKCLGCGLTARSGRKHCRGCAKIEEKKEAERADYLAFLEFAAKNAPAALPPR